MRVLLKILSKIWKYFVLLLTVLLFIWLCYGIYFISVHTDNLTRVIIKEEIVPVTIAGAGMLLIVFSFLISFYINLLKKDIEIQNLMGGLENRTDEYQSQVVFWKNGGPSILIYYLDIGGHFLLPFIQRRKNYENIDITKISFKKKIPFIMLWLSLTAGLFLVIIGYLNMPSDEEQFVVKEKKYRATQLNKKQKSQAYNQCIDNDELCLCFFKTKGKYSSEVVPCRYPNGSKKVNKSGFTHFKLTKKRLESAEINIEDIIGHKKTNYKTSYGNIKQIEMSEEEEANLYK